MGRDAFDTYGQSWRTLNIPPREGESFDTKGDFLADGRIVAVTGSTVYLERTAGSALFDAVGVLDASEIGAATDPAFLRVSPDGSNIAIGAGFGKPLAVFSTSALGTPGAPTALTSGSVARYFNVGHYDAAWQSGSHLAITAGDFGSPAYVSLLDVTSSPAAPSNPVIVSGIEGSSGGIAFDAAGRLYTGNGFSNGSGSLTGAIRAFASDLWEGGAVNFEVAGVLVANLLSGSSMLFDLEGNLIVGGGNFGVDMGYLGVIGADALGAALDGLGPIDPSDVSQLLRLDPLGDGSGYFGSAFNPTTGELFVTNGATWHGTIPGPSALVLMAAAGLHAVRRRRHV